MKLSPKAYLQGAMAYRPDYTVYCPYSLIDQLELWHSWVLCWKTMKRLWELTE